MSEQTTRPILFSGEMVRAILDGRKTQTRRPVKWPKSLWFNDDGYPIVGDGYLDCRPVEADDIHEWITCPFGKRGGTLWVRETWGTGTRPDPHDGWRDGIEYRADAIGLDERDALPLHDVEVPNGVELDSFRPGWHPSIHMPRWACRLILDVTDVRVERVQAISADDAVAEGFGREREADLSTHQGTWVPRRLFSRQWDAIYDSKGLGWDENPFVWAVTFQVHEGPTT